MLFEIVLSPQNCCPLVNDCLLETAIVLQLSFFALRLVKKILFLKKEHFL